MLSVQMVLAEKYASLKYQCLLILRVEVQGTHGHLETTSSCLTSGKGWAGPLGLGSGPGPFAAVIRGRFSANTASDFLGSISSQFLGSPCGSLF